MLFLLYNIHSKNEAITTMSVLTNNTNLFGDFCEGAHGRYGHGPAIYTKPKVIIFCEKGDTLGQFLRGGIIQGGGKSSFQLESRLPF